MTRLAGRSPWRLAALLLLGLLVVAAAGVLWAAAHYARAVRNLSRGVGDTVFLSGDGAPWFRLDETRHDVALAEIAADLQHAVVAVEDRRFYLHPGIDPVGIARAVIRAARPGVRAEGASTLTQQLARTLFLSNTRTIGRKAREGSLALLLELELSKAQILELYLNRIYLSAGVYGVQAMSELLFRKPASHLTLPEAALIAGLIRAPSTLSPWSNYEAALRRSHVVLGLMREQGFISRDEEQAARLARPAVQPYRRPREGASGWVKDYLRQQFRDVFGGDHPPDWTVQTSVQPAAQAAAEQAVRSGLDRLKRPGLQAALVALEARSGRLLAMVGGADYMTSSFNRAVRSRRQPGSAFKPLVFAAALTRGFSPVSRLSGLDHVQVPGDPEWAPAGHGGLTTLTLREALTESNNAAAAVLLQQVTSAPVLALASDAGLSNLPDVPSLALGSGEVTLLDLTAAYTAFAAGGAVARPRALDAVRDADGTEVYAEAEQRRQVLSPAAAYQLTSMLRDVVDKGTGRGARARGVSGPLAGKTGTTDDYHDAWFVGYSSTVVAGVWVGFDQPKPIGGDAYASAVAVPIWADFMRRVAPLSPPGEFARPASIEAVELCAVSHQRPGRECPVYTEFFKDGDAIPDEPCAVHAQSFEVRATQAVQGFFRALGGRLGRIFGRRGD